MSRPKIRLDVSEHLVLVVCSACPSWRESASTTQQGWRLAQVHATFVHRDDSLAASFRGRANRQLRGSL